MIVLVIVIRTIALNLYGKTFSDLLAFSRKIVNGLNNHVSDYPSPPINTSTMKDDNDRLEDAIKGWGQKGNRGSHVQYTALIEARQVVRENLRITANYVLQATVNDVSKWEAVGFVIKSGKTPKRKMEAVRNLEQVFSMNVSKGEIELRWLRPQNARKTERITYLVFRASTEIDKPEYIGSTTRTKFTDVTGNGNIYYYYILPENAFGEGVISSPCPAAAAPTVTKKADSDL